MLFVYVFMYMFYHIISNHCFRGVIADWYWGRVIWSWDIWSEDRKVSSNDFPIRVSWETGHFLYFFFLISVFIHARHLIPTSSKLFSGQQFEAGCTVEIRQPLCTNLLLSVAALRIMIRKMYLAARSSIKSVKWIILLVSSRDLAAVLNIIINN